MKIKILTTTIFLFIICAFFSCSRNDLDVEDPSARKAILGKWELIAYGETEDDMCEQRSDGSYTEFLSDGTLRIWDPNFFSMYGEQGGFNWKGTYKIYSDSLVCSVSPSDNNRVRTESSQKYSFSGDTLYLIDLHYSPPSGDVINTWMHSPPYLIYKRKN